MENLEEYKVLVDSQLLKVQEKLPNIENEYIVEAIMQFDNLAFDYEERKQRLLLMDKESNIEKLMKRLEARFDSYVVAYVLFLDKYLNDKHDYTVEELTIVEDVFDQFGLTNLDSRRSDNRGQIYKIFHNAQLQEDIREFIADQLCNYNEEIESHDAYTSLLFEKVIFEMLYVTTSELDYTSLFRPRVASYSLRLDESEHRLNEIVRAYHSNEFITPTINDLFKRFIIKHYEELLKADPGKIRKIERDYDEYSKSQNRKIK